MFNFSFEGGVAVIRNAETGDIVVYQPFKPVNAGQEPWADAAEAEAYMRDLYPHYFLTLPEPTVPPPAEDEIPTPPAEPGQGE